MVANGGKSPEAFRTISEVSEELVVPAHVLRFWESRFTQIKPVKRAGGRRYYRPDDVLLISGIRRLLHDEGLTIRGVQKILRERGVPHVVAIGAGEETGGIATFDAPVRPSANIRPFRGRRADVPAPESLPSLTAQAAREPITEPGPPPEPVPEPDPAPEPQPEAIRSLPSVESADAILVLLRRLPRGTTIPAARPLYGRLDALREKMRAAG